MDPNDRLAKMFDAQRAEIEYRRRRENEIFTWSSTILIGFITASALFTSDKAVVLLQTWRGAIPVAAMMAIVAAFSFGWQGKQRKYMKDNQRVLVGIERALSFYDGDGATYPKEWQDHGARSRKDESPLGAPSKRLATLLLGAIATVAPLVSVLFARCPPLR